MRFFHLAIPLVLAMAATNAVAFDEPPIKDAQDAACREEARAKVFTLPDPQGKGVYTLGKEIYDACIARSQARSPRK